MQSFPNRNHSDRFAESLSYLILASTFDSTWELNRVLAGLKAKIDPEHLRRIEELEKEGLFGRGRPWEQGRYPAEYTQLVGAWAYYAWFYEDHTTANYNPSGFGLAWDVYREMSGLHGEFVIDGNMTPGEYADEFKTLHVPTLVIAGEDDAVTLGMLKEMHTNIKGSQLASCRKPHTSPLLIKLDCSTRRSMLLSIPGRFRRG